MAMARIGVRAGETLTRAWSLIRQRAKLAGDPNKVRAGDKTKDLQKLVALRNASASGISPALQTELEKIKWIDIGGGKRIMKGEVTVRLFKLVMEGYEITGHDADRLKAILADPAQEGNALTHVSLLDGRELAKRLAILKGKTVSVQTSVDWEVARNKLSGANWTWTKTPFSPHSQEFFVLRYLVGSTRVNRAPGNRWNDCAVRLVEDK